MNSEEILKYQQVLRRTYEESIKRNEAQYKIWNKYKSGHEKVIEGLRVLPLEASINCMVPVGKRALMKGRLVHTNEILVCLGEGYFAKYSAARAIALCNRRIEEANEKLKRIQAERNLLEMRQIIQLQYDVFAKGDNTEIIEHCNEKDLEDWRAAHRQKEKEYHQKLSDLRKKEKTEIKTEEDLFRRLDELEIEEELEDEMDRLEEEHRKFYEDLEEGEVYYETDDEDSLSEDLSREAIEKELEKLKKIRLQNSINEAHTDVTVEEVVKSENYNVIDTEVCGTSKETTIESLEHIDKALLIPCKKTDGYNIREESYEKSETETIQNNEDNIIGHNRRKVSFAEPCIIEEEDEALEIAQVKDINEKIDYIRSEDDTIKINFKHSDENPVTSESDGSNIETPHDIYKRFSFSKSILKRSPGDLYYNQNIPPPAAYSSEEENEDNADTCIKPSAYKSVVKDIQERTSETMVKGCVEQKTRSISRFKMQRDSMKK